MPKIDVYLRSIERFGASGAVLTSGQSVTLRFPTGDRHATQVTPHDQLVMLVREIAPPYALDKIDKNQPARFDLESNGIRYTLAVTPKQGMWQVGIEPAGAGSAPAVGSVPPAANEVAFNPPTLAPSKPTRSSMRNMSAPEPSPDLAIERGQYEGGGAVMTPVSGSALLDQLTAAARVARAADLYLATGAPPTMRVGGELRPVGDRGPLDADTVSRELGVVAPPDARGAWSERGIAMFTYFDGTGRVRVTLSRDHRGPLAALRMLVPEPPTLERLQVPREVSAWLEQRGVILVAGAAGAGKTTTLAALVAALAAQQKRIVTIEDPIEIVHASPFVSQRAVGEHVADLAAGVTLAMREGADVIVVGAIANPAGAVAVVEAAAAGHLVLATINAPARTAVDHLLDQLPADRVALGRRVLGEVFCGAVAPVASGSGRAFDVQVGQH